jgi:hypothetical protein
MWRECVQWRHIDVEWLVKEAYAVVDKLNYGVAFSVLRRCIRDGGCNMAGPLSDAFLCYCTFASALRYCLLWRATKVLSNRNNNVFGLRLYLLCVVNPLKPNLVCILFKDLVRTSKRTPHFTITKINWLTLFKFNPLKPNLVCILFKNSVRTSKRTPHFTITKINWLTLFKFNPLKTKLV